MNKNELIKMFRQWREDEENEKIVAAILALPENELDDDIMSWLAEAYIDIEEYKKAIAVLEGQRERLEDDYRWHFRLALALMHAAEDEECEDDDDLKVNILTRAKVDLARGMNMNPPEEILQTADSYMEQIEDMLDELTGGDDEDDEDDESDLEIYEEEEMDVIEEHIKEHYGDFPTVFHEISSPDIHCDICIVPPTNEKNYYTLLTMGMGARLMDIPEDLDPSESGRAELLICLPPDWKVGENSEEWFWPIALLKNLARLPINCDSWLGWGHSIDNEGPYALNTELCGSLLIYPEGAGDGAESCMLPNGDIVTFYEVIPIFREEMDFKIRNGTKPLLERMQGVSHVLDIRRRNCCEDFSATPLDIIDSVSEHSDKIADKNLPLDPINGANHIAIFLRWCVEHDLIAPEFYEKRPDVVEGVLSGKQTDLREFIINCFRGILESRHLSFLGAAFVNYYYNWDVDEEEREYFFPEDVDRYAEEYFGEEQYKSEKFKNEAYLFVPFDEDYYKGLSEYIERAFATFYPTFVTIEYESARRTAKKITKHYGIKAHAVREFYNVKKEYQLAVSQLKDPKVKPMVLIMMDAWPVKDPEDYAKILEAALNPYLKAIAVAQFPKNIVKWGAMRFHVQDPVVFRKDERLIELTRRAKETFGVEPAVLTFDEKCATLFVPYKEEDDTYIRFTGPGLPFTFGDPDD